MTKHIPIQDPAAFSDAQLMSFAAELFSPLTATDELERICMTLAHFPTEEAQRLLRRFAESERASEVSWLECAVDEGAFHLLTPHNEQEERDLLTLKVIEEIEDRITELVIRHDELDLARRKDEVRATAIQALVAAGRLDPEELLGLGDARLCLDNDIAELDEQIAREEAICEQLERSIETPRYRKADRVLFRNIHLD